MKVAWFLLLLLAGFSLGAGIKMLAEFAKYIHRPDVLFPDILDYTAIICVSLFMMIFCLFNIIRRKE